MKLFNKEPNEKHVHCIICSSCLDTTTWGKDQPYEYVCERCVATFSSDYILHRIECDRKGIYKKEFAILEARLSLGDRHLDNTNSDYNGLGIDSYVVNFKKWLK